MPQSPFPFPGLTPLTRLHVHDNLRINAERWALAHEYHRQRQNIHYQSLWQPGIVYGLGVKQISAPKTASPQFRDNCWLEVQPGLAIDGEGNPIVVSAEDDRTYHLALPNLTRPSQTVHLVLRYVDPHGLEIPRSTDRVLERFRFDQYIDQLRPNDIELCRITLSQHNGSIDLPKDPLNPKLNQLDLRYRPWAQLRPLKWLTLGYVGQIPSKKLESLTTLLASLPALYPQLQGKLEPSPLFSLSADKWHTIDITYMEAQTLVRWQQEPNDASIKSLKQYIKSGGSLLIEASMVTAEVKQALQSLKRDLQLQKVPPDHAVRNVPFLFRDWPSMPKSSIELFYEDNIWLFVGSITDAWGGYGLPRHEIRTYHEWGINLLHHLWMKHHFQSLLR